MQTKQQDMRRHHRRHATTGRANFAHQRVAAIGHGAKRLRDLSRCQQHKPIDGTSQVQSLGAAGDGLGEKIFGDRDEISLCAGLDLQIAFETGRQPQQRRRFERHIRAA